MPVYYRKCPECGSPSSRHYETKWLCINCSNLFDEEVSSLRQSQADVNLGGRLFDVEPADPADEQPYEVPYLSLKEPYLNLKDSHRDLAGDPFEEDSKIIEIENLHARLGIIEWFSLVLFPLFLMCGFLFISSDAWAYVQVRTGQAALITVLCFTVGTFFFVSLLIINKRQKKLRQLEENYLNTLKITVGWIALCPSCKEEHSRYRNEEKDPTSGPVHCKSCGKQFLLLSGKAYVIKR